MFTRMLKENGYKIQNGKLSRKIKHENITLCFIRKIEFKKEKKIEIDLTVKPISYCQTNVKT